MSNAREFIKQRTNYGSNKMIASSHEYHEWLTPKQALKAVEIARVEIYDWLSSHYRDYMHNPTGRKLEAFFGRDMITDLKQAMKDE